VFDRIISTMSKVIEAHPDDQETLSYWLSTTTTLLFLLQRTLRTSQTQTTNISKRRGGLFDRWSRTLANKASVAASALGAPASPGPAAPASPTPAGVAGGLKEVEAKYPALLFKQQLTAFVEKIYGMVRDNVKRQITTELGQCIQAPRAGRAAAGPDKASPATAVAGRKSQNSTLSPHWIHILTSLTELLDKLKSNKVPAFLICELIKQVFSFVNVQLFNSLLLRRECCSFSNGEYVRTGLAELEAWLHDAGDAHVGLSWDELRYIRQAVEFLVIHQKPKKTLEEITNDLCPVRPLNLSQPFAPAPSPRRPPSSNLPLLPCVCGCRVPSHRCCPCSSCTASPPCTGTIATARRRCRRRCWG